MKNWKKLFAGLITALMVITAFVALASDNISIILNGDKVVFNDAQPIVYEDRTLVPVRAVFEKAGWDVAWDNNSNTAIIGNNEKVIFITIDNMSMGVYDIDTDMQEEVLLDVSAMLIDGSTMIPLRSVCEAMGANVDWDEATQTVYISEEEK